MCAHQQTTLLTENIKANSKGTIKTVTTEHSLRIEPRRVEQQLLQLLHGQPKAHSCTRIALEAGVVELLLLTCFPKCGAEHMTHSQLRLLEPQLLSQLPKMMLCPTAILTKHETCNYLLQHGHVCLGLKRQQQ